MIALKDHYYAIKRALTLLFQGHFLLYFIPGLVIAILFYIYLFVIESVGSLVGLISYTPWIGAYMETATNSVFSWVNSLSLFIYQFTIITLLSPFHTMLSQGVETLEKGIKLPSNWSKVFNDILRTMGVVIVGGMIYFFIYLIWTAFAFLFGLSILSPFVSAVLIGFFTGFNSYDYSLERHGVSVIKSWVYAFRNPFQMILTGGIFTFLLFIPLLGVVVAPVLLTMVGTINYLRMEERKNEDLSTLRNN